MARGKRKSEKQEKEPEQLQKTNEEKTVIDSAETDKKNDLEKT